MANVYLVCIGQEVPKFSGSYFISARILVFHEERHPRKGTRAVRARILFHRGMSLQVCSKIRTIRECTLTFWALVRFFARVRANMTLKQPRTAERLSTNRALAWQRVSANMHLQCTEWKIVLVAMLACKLFPCTFILLLRNIACWRVSFALLRFLRSVYVSLRVVVVPWDLIFHGVVFFFDQISRCVFFIRWCRIFAQNRCCLQHGPYVTAKIRSCSFCGITAFRWKSVPTAIHGRRLKELLDHSRIWHRFTLKVISSTCLITQHELAR